jgi:[NiFe] hydrogenase assembly HybE family chaperone
MSEPGLLPDPSGRIESAFSATAQRMQGLGFVNPALRVEAVDFAAWEGHWLGVLVTPWSINLMLLPHDPARWQRLRAGERQRYTFPAGAYDFIGAADETLGEYQMCSLFSPALDFADHGSARLVAQLALQALFDPAHAEPAALADGSVDGDAPGPLARLQQQVDAPLSKRDFLRGRFLRSGDRR